MTLSCAHQRTRLNDVSNSSANYLIDHVDAATYKDRKLFFNSIVYILHRREFDVQALGMIRLSFPFLDR